MIRKPYPNIWTLKSLIRAADGTSQTQDKHEAWVPARPLGFMSFWSRLQAARLVFDGKADAVIWPGEAQ